MKLLEENIKKKEVALKQAQQDASRTKEVSVYDLIAKEEDISRKVKINVTNSMNQINAKQ
jgi:hypothetical protein